MITAKRQLYCKLFSCSASMLLHGVEEPSKILHSVFQKSYQRIRFPLFWGNEEEGKKKSMCLNIWNKEKAVVTSAA